MKDKQLKVRGRPKGSKSKIEESLTGPQNIVLNTKQLCSIIKVSATAGVSRLVFGSLTLDFGTKDPSTKTPQLVETKPLEQEILKNIEEAETQKRESFLQDDLAQLWLTNPSEAERLVLEGEIGDGESP